MAPITVNTVTNEPRGSQARGAVECANASLLYSLCMPLTAAGCATATTTSKVKTANTLTYTISGKFYTKTGTDNFWTLAAGTTVPAASWQKYLLLIDTAGAASTIEGVPSPINAAAVAWSNVSAISAYSPVLLALGSGRCIAGVLTVATDATHTFIPGTTLLGATGITATFIDGIDQSLLPLIGNEPGAIVGNGG
jgi:hypothetical protein